MMHGLALSPHLRQLEPMGCQPPTVSGPSSEAFGMHSMNFDVHCSPLVSRDAFQYIKLHHVAIEKHEKYEKTLPSFYLDNCCIMTGS